MTCYRNGGKSNDAAFRKITIDDYFGSREFAVPVLNAAPVIRNDYYYTRFSFIFHISNFEDSFGSRIAFALIYIYIYLLI